MSATVEMDIVAISQAFTDVTFTIQNLPVLHAGHVDILCQNEIGHLSGNHAPAHSLQF